LSPSTPPPSNLVASSTHRPVGDMPDRLPLPLPLRRPLSPVAPALPHDDGHPINEGSKPSAGMMTSIIDVIMVVVVAASSTRQQ
jgi:hypothetical protein